MAAVDRLREAVATIPAVDHHAHVLARPNAAIRLAEVLTESCDEAQIRAVFEELIRSLENPYKQD